MAYIFSYYAISLACTGSIYNYVLVGMFGELSRVPVPRSSTVLVQRVLAHTYCNSPVRESDSTRKDRSLLLIFRS
jgi:hypothetical protein